jgi:enediyne biosynthesis protein E4
MGSRRLWLGLFLVAGSALAAGYGAVRVIDVRRLRTGLDQARQEMAAGQYRTARKRLAEFSRSHTGQGEVEYELGVCELKLGRPAAALAAWERIGQSSPYAAKAALQRATVVIETGRFTLAEEILDRALVHSTGVDSLRLLQKLAMLCEIEGRTDEMRANLIESWRYSDAPAALLRQLSRQDLAKMPLLTLRQYLEKGASDDDRVWLGRANLATKTGQLDVAAKWLNSCLERRPNDPVVWRARLELAQAGGDVALGWQALEHLPAAGVSEVELARIRGWIVAAQPDPSAERTALKDLAQRDPGDIAALNRLATLAARSGDKSELVRLRETIAEISARKERYQSLTSDEQAEGDPAELSRLAEQLGRVAEARGWAFIRDGKLARAGLSRDPLVPAGPSGATRSGGSSNATTLADRCADLRMASPSRGAADRLRMVPRYVDLAESAGLRFVHDNADSPRKRPPETMSGGVALLDYDGDGLLDVFAVQGGPLPPPVNASCEDHLYRNLGNGTFEDVSERAGLRRISAGYGHGVSVGDYDNDGRPDVFVTRWRSYLLLHNRPDGTFADVTTLAGLAGDRDWPTSAAWADLDGDGDLDLYVCHYLVFDLAKPTICQNAQARVNHYCSPRDFQARPDHVFRNDGGRSFVDVTKESGFTDPDGRGLGVVAADLDDDNRIDIYVANDMSANYLFRNLGGFRFEETAMTSGAAANASGSFQSGMGVACADFDADGTPDLAVTNFYGESTSFFRNLGHGLFADDTAMIGLAAPTRCLLGFGISFLDANNDGWLDLISANGHVNDHRPAFPWRMPTQLLLGGPDGRLNDPYPRLGVPFEALHLGRGLAVGDLDNDGQLDAVVQSQNEPLAYLHNQTEAGGHWVTFQLEGTRSNRDGVGARVTLTIGGRKRVEQRTGGGSYQSAADPRLHFGLGECARIDRVEVRWPSGLTEHHEGLETNRGYLLREGSRIVEPLKGWINRSH